MRDELIGDGRTAASDQIVTRPGGKTVVAGNDVVEIGDGDVVEAREQRCCAAEGRKAGERAALVGEGDEAGPRGSGEAGAADDVPGRIGGVVVGVVDGDAGVGIGVEGDVGGGAVVIAL